MSSNSIPTIEQLADLLTERIRGQLEQLLESKHLYQSIQLEYRDLVDGIEHDSAVFLHLSPSLDRLARGEWQPSDPAARRLMTFEQDTPSALWFEVPDVKLFCQVCKRIEAFNVASAEDFLERGYLGSPYKIGDDIVQVFIVSCQCQSCKTVPEVFLIRRKGMKLTLSGRSEIEHVSVPSTIPKVVQHFYSGAIVAHQSGQTLAGVFLLRTLIEQWARLQAGEPELEAKDAIEKYMSTLPKDFKNRFMSMRNLYGDLSEDIHSAAGSAELFDRARIAVEEHFDARRLYRL